MSFEAFRNVRTRITNWTFSDVMTPRWSSLHDEKEGYRVVLKHKKLRGKKDWLPENISESRPMALEPQVLEGRVKVRFSVVIPVYNRARISSPRPSTPVLPSQTFTDFEVIMLSTTDPRMGLLKYYVLTAVALRSSGKRIKDPKLRETRALLLLKANTLRFWTATISFFLTHWKVTSG